jgi:hypothetical protein
MFASGRPAIDAYPAAEWLYRRIREDRSASDTRTLTMDEDAAA